ncbi:hypothetical protein Ahy_Scaffold5g107744 isoform B [Arachis hypogaea]|uniref:Uncharacterized protein n=1 Tax=Arachis hypogaea TaxID=3818 RepID=A0A444WQ29_ARAHY|nr:hypothetical protein Ahy_Scaffold5g107744 isoform B [Arachis hypogaea]
MEFDTLEQLKHVLKDYTIAEGRRIFYVKNDKRKIRCKCASGKEKTMIAKNWVADKFEKRLLTQPYLTYEEAFDHIKIDFNVVCSDKMIYRVLRKQFWQQYIARNNLHNSWFTTTVYQIVCLFGWV